MLRCCLLLAAILAAPWYGTVAEALELQGDVVEGGLVFGKAPPGSAVQFDGERIRVSPRGDFLLGFSRDADRESVLEIRYPDGTRERKVLGVAQRDYEVQKIDGLPPSKVTPDARNMKRIRREQALINEARKRDDARTDYLAGFVWPTSGRISGVYGSQRILNGKPKRPHFGVDIAAPTGTPVRAPAPGIVSLTAQDMYFTGGTVMVDHGHGLSSVFIHMSKVLVTQGEAVRQGDLLGEVGATGRATGPHLHWGMNLFNRRIDPQRLVGPMPAASTSPR
jgi:murein DD-endopeptidase MepM/ murein hydrolase activator NlpD